MYIIITRIKVFLSLLSNICKNAGSMFDENPNFKWASSYMGAKHITTVGQCTCIMPRHWAFNSILNMLSLVACITKLRQYILVLSPQQTQQITGSAFWNSFHLNWQNNNHFLTNQSLCVLKSLYTGGALFQLNQSLVSCVTWANHSQLLNYSYRARNG